MDQKEKECRELNQEEMERTAGGTFNKNAYSDSVYASFGIKVVKNTILWDEFWWKGQDIGHRNANLVVEYCRINGHEPDSIKDLDQGGMVQRLIHSN